jgi:hypothetical protein
MNQSERATFAVWISCNCCVLVGILPPGSIGWGGGNALLLLALQLLLPLPAAVSLLPWTVVPTLLLLQMTMLLVSLLLLLLLLLLVDTVASGCCTHSHAAPSWCIRHHTAAYTSRPGYLLRNVSASTLACRRATALLLLLPFASTTRNLPVPSVKSMSPTRRPISGFVTSHS